ARIRAPRTDEARREVRDGPRPATEAGARRLARARGIRRQHVPCARSPREVRFVSHARRRAVLADAVIAILAQAGPARGLHALGGARTALAVLVVGAVGGTAGYRRRHTGVAARSGRRIVGPERLGSVVRRCRVETGRAVVDRESVAPCPVEVGARVFAAAAVVAGQGAVAA